MSTVTSDPPRGGLFVGRGAELTRLRALFGEGASQVVFVHGVSGNGKSALLRQLARHAGPPSSRLIALDCQEIEPTPQGFLVALAAAAGADGTGDDDRDLTWLASRADNVVVCLDQYEVLRLLDTWLRQAFVPSLPLNVRLVIAGREEPHTAWNRLPAGTFEALCLGPLSAAHSVALLAGLGVDGAPAHAIVRFAGGHPLTLLLAALAAKEQPVRTIREVTLDRLLDEFTQVYLQDLDAETRELLEAAAIVRRVTRPLLAALLPDDAWKGFQRLAGLPFVDGTGEGLAIHESLRQAVATQVQAADPSRHRQLRRRAWTYLRNELRDVPRSELWRHTADMVYLIENPFVREAHFPSNAHAFAIEPATDADADVIDALITSHETPTSADLLRTWWRRRPDVFRVARDTSGAVAGFFILATSEQVDLRTFARDPVVAGWLDHLERNPIPAGQHLLLARRWLTWEAGEGLCEAQAAFWLDMKRTYMSLRPRLRRNYGTTIFPEIYGQVLGSLGGGAIPNGAVDIDGVKYHGMYLDFGPSSVDGWLTSLAADELGLPEDELLDVRQRQLLVNGGRVDLTPLEFEVFHYLRERHGAPVTRQELLADVWGYHSANSSNVVDTVVHGLRKKLGDDAVMIETIRGVGYRLHEPSRP